MELYLWIDIKKNSFLCSLFLSQIVSNISTWSTLLIHFIIVNTPTVLYIHSQNEYKDDISSWIFSCELNNFF